MHAGDGRGGEEFGDTNDAIPRTIAAAKREVKQCSM